MTSKERGGYVDFSTYPQPLLIRSLALELQKNPAGKTWGLSHKKIDFSTLRIHIDCSLRNVTSNPGYPSICSRRLEASQKRLGAS